MYFNERRCDFPLLDINIREANPHDLEVMSKELALGLSVEEMERIRHHFLQEGRNPTDVEMQALGQAWSEHCCYKSSLHYLKEHILMVDNEDVIARDDAGVMAIDDEWAYALRIESHNHPSAIEPYGGAATGIGGIIRDVLCMGAQPVALVDPLYFGPLDMRHRDLPVGVKHPKYLMSGVVAGIRDYGNRIGIPTVSGGLYFDQGYVGNCIVNVGCLGVVRRDKVTLSAVGGAGDVLVLVGGRTGRDGIHGVTFASAELTEESEEEDRGAVQLGDPITKEPLIHACLEVNERGLLRGMKDLGGGGLSCVCGEIAHAAGYGVQVDIGRVPTKEEGLEPWEIWISESQERMMLAVAPDDVEEVLSVFDLWDVEATVLGHTIREQRARIF
ncbi:MAG: phosphoribosylformylglycinamidine synthase II, partial [Thermoplasmata archaeon]|nr:phosphoribosylformylglycinamidine synthase II [Thermoplasmata archaeon]NIS11629.1 phosphoribosylformylglycinamidine synthase II [Thermoplasmata archaeon]NIS19536.1 phosphoribosylformylglycinamidine synthase II [Thermoplasmata archaeon]NIT76682.1 phosphoribosylformylglycinamidine synthase II [Thermoplasmata archaeon]NIU48652.1 phosphoribosylformylglycinamidine synthase II [Thermoplasmata archaeon]